MRREFLALVLMLSVWRNIPEGSYQEVKSPAFKIGATLALTGRYAFIGEAERDGLLLGVEEINARGGINGRRLELLAEDNLGDSKTALTSVNKLLTVDQVDVVFSAFTHITQAIKGLMARENKVLLYASTLKEIAADHPLFFRDYCDIEEAGRLLARSAAAASYRSITYLKDDSESGAWHAQGFIEEARASGLKIKYQDEFSSGEPDLRPVLLKLSRYKPQAMVFCAWRDVNTVMKQLKELGLIGIQTFHLTAPFFPIADTIEMRRLYAENKTISSWYGFAESTSDQAAQGFIRKFRARFGRTPFPDSAFAYDDVMILAQGLAVCSEAGAVEQPCLADYLQRVVYEGPAGRVHFGAARSADRPVIAIKLTGGRWEEVG